MILAPCALGTCRLRLCWPALCQPGPAAETRACGLSAPACLWVARRPLLTPHSHPAAACLCEARSAPESKLLLR